MSFENPNNQVSQDNGKDGPKISRRNFLIGSALGTASLLAGCEKPTEKAPEKISNKDKEKRAWSEQMVEERKREHEKKKEKDARMFQKIKEFAQSKNIPFNEKNLKYSFQMKEFKVDSLSINGKDVHLSPDDKETLTKSYQWAYYGEMNEEIGNQILTPTQKRDLDAHVKRGSVEMNPNDF